MRISEYLLSGGLGRVELLNPARLAAADKLSAPIISIDGGSAVGKSSLGQKMSAALGLGLVHTDDFFLPEQMRGKQRLSEPGGNLHYERFIDQVLPYLRSGKVFSYDIFDCSVGEINNSREVQTCSGVIVEGAYSNHPRFGEPYDLKIFVCCDERTRYRRLTKRNGEEMRELFLERWIPLEEAYFKAFSVEEHCDIIMNTGEEK